MKRFFVTSLLASLAVIQLSAGTVNVTFNGANGQTDKAGNLISPYTATVNGVSTTIYCVDFANEVSNGQQWTANVTSLASGNLTQTRYGSISQTFGGTTYNATQLNEMAAYLTTQFSGNSSANGDIQDTIWDLFNPNSYNSGSVPPTPSSNYWLSQAESNYSKISYTNFNILTNSAPVAYSGSGQVQEFIFTPEPSSIVLLGFGLIAISIAGRRKLRAAKATF